MFYHLSVFININDNHVGNSNDRNLLIVFELKKGPKHYYKHASQAKCSRKSHELIEFRGKQIFFNENYNNYPAWFLFITAFILITSVSLYSANKERELEIKKFNFPLFQDCEKKESINMLLFYTAFIPRNIHLIFSAIIRVC